MLATLVLTPILGKGDAKLRRVNPAIMTVVPAAALLAAFFTLTFQETLKSPVHLLTVVSSAAAMGLCLVIAKRFRLPWLREWGLGIAIFVSLTVAYLVTSSAPVA